MAENGTTGSRLEVQEDRAWQERFWTIQRIAWIVMALFVLAALVGATGGGGPMASARVETPDGTIEYPRIARWQTTEKLKVSFAGGAGNRADVELDRAFADLFSVESVEPEPEQVVATGGGHRFTFELGEGDGTRTVTFQVKPSSPTLPRTIGARLGNAPPARLNMAVLP